LTATVTSTTASNIVVTDNSTTNTNYLPTFVTASGSSQPVSVDTGLTYNPFTNTLTATNITATGTLSGTFGGTITNATNAVNTGISAVTTGTTYYPTFVSATSGNNPQLVDTDLQFNSTTNTLTCPTISTQTINSTSATGNLAIGGNLTAGGGNLTLGGTTSTLTIKNPFTPTYGYTSSGTTNVIAGTGAGKIGEVKYNKTALTSTINPASLPRTVASITVDSAGVYMLNFGSQYWSSGFNTQLYFNLTVTGTTDAGLYDGNIGYANIISSPAPYYYGVIGCWIVQPAGAGTYVISCTGLTPNIVNVDYVNIKTVRIA
jgi:hypothetical protein